MVSLRVGIEADRMWANRFGIGRFVRGAVRGLQEAAPQHEYRLFTLTTTAVPSRHFLAPARVLRGLRRMWWLRGGLAAQVRAQQVDVFFCPDYLVPRRVSCPLVAVIHDLLFLEHPEWGEPLINCQLRWEVPRTLRVARRIVVPSNWTRDRLVSRLRCRPADIAVVPEGVAPALETAEAPPPAKRFFLSVGAWAPRKNLARVIEAFARIAPWYDGQLLMVGGGGWGQDRLRAAIRRWQLEPRVVVKGFVSDPELGMLYAQADALVFPSLYEGFGLPVIEAMARGCPVITSNVTALPEVAGEGAYLIDPHDTTALAEAMRRMVQDAAWRQHWQDAGRRRAQAFTWRRTGEHLNRVFHDAAGAV